VETFVDREMELDLYQFRTWLRTHPASQVVGVSCLGDRCPVAQWLRQQYNKRFYVNTLTIEQVEVIEDSQRRHINQWGFTPEWVETFINRIDPGPVREREITAQEALDVLDALGEEHHPDQFLLAS